MIKIANNLIDLLRKKAQDAGGHGGAVGFFNAPRRPTGTGFLGAHIRGPRKSTQYILDPKPPAPMPPVQIGETITDSARMNALRGSLTDDVQLAGDTTQIPK